MTFDDLPHQVERPQIHEADLLEYFDQAIALRHALLFLRSDPACAINGSLRPLDIVRTESLATLDGATRARVLQRQYALLISMAPMEPLCEHVYTAGLPVTHFGPTFSLLTSPWFQLALYTALGCGPPSILLPRGTRLRRVPDGLRLYSHLLLTPWGGEPVVSSTSHLLSVAADLLTRAPLLVQAYVADASAGTARLPMPVADAPETPKAAANLGQNLGQIADAPEAPLLEAPPAALPSLAIPTGEGITTTETESDGAHEDASRGEGPHAAASGAHEDASRGEGPHAAASGAHEDASRGEGPHAAARRVMHALGLESSIGMLQLVHLQLDHVHAKAEAGGPPRTAWVPLMMHFGLPLCDVPTCEAVCAQVRQRLLCSASRTGAACKCSPRRLPSFPTGAATTALQCESAAGPHRRCARAAAARARLCARVHGRRGGRGGQGPWDGERGGERRVACRLCRERHVPMRAALLRRPLHATAVRSGEVRSGVPHLAIPRR